jgi:CheY-like chemotaxis protein
MIANTRNTILNLVIADDDSDDHYLIQKAIWEMNLNHKVTSVYNGQQLMDFLQGEGLYDNCIEGKPDCIFLDINMPLLNGLETLTKIKKNKSLNGIPIFIISTTIDEYHKNKFLELGVTGLFRKATKYDQVRLTVKEALDAVLHGKPG